MVERVCPNCKIPMNVDKCVKASCQTKTIMSTTLYWCDDCNIPVFEPMCPRCGTAGKYIATDVRPVFPEERLLLALIQGKRHPHCYDTASVWYGSGAYFINGKKEKISTTEINKWSLEKIKSIKEAYDELVDNIDTTYFDENIAVFVEANRDRYNYITEEAMRFVLSYKDQYAIKDMMVSFSGGKDSTVTSHIVNTAFLIEVISKKPWNNNRISLYLAKMWGLSEKIFEKEADDTSVLNVVDAPEEQFYELLDYQYYIKQRTLYNLNSGNAQERMLIHMPTGTGKTKTTMHIITNYIEFTMHKKGVVIWVAHTIELLEQAYKTFCSVWGHLGDGEITAYKLWGNHMIQDTSDELNGIAFCGLSKLMSLYDSNPALFERLKRDCRLIVFDEAHKAAADKTKRIIENLMLMPQSYENRALVGLSATPGRTTEASYDNNLLTNMFGGKLIHIDADVINQINMGRLRALNSIAEENIIKYFQERRILSKITSERLKYKRELGNNIRMLKYAMRRGDMDGVRRFRNYLILR